ncbi:MAG: hypothetical protein OXE78_01045 [Gammaproteobacteria bacterium]|nr:hypothetical protein [Gammaproteobacteria bacterium]
MLTIRIGRADKGDDSTSGSWQLTRLINDNRQNSLNIRLDPTISAAAHGNNWLDKRLRMLQSRPMNFFHCASC